MKRNKRISLVNVVARKGALSVPSFYYSDPSRWDNEVIFYIHKCKANANCLCTIVLN